MLDGAPTAGRWPFSRTRVSVILISAPAGPLVLSALHPRTAVSAATVPRGRSYDSAADIHTTPWHIEQLSTRRIPELLNRVRPTRTSWPR